MATKVKPCRIKATGTPQAGYVPKYVDEDTFQWGAGGGGSGDVVVSTDTGNELSTGVALWFGTESDYSSISTPDTNTLYIQYKSDGGQWQPGVNTLWYLNLNQSDAVFTDYKGHTVTNNGITYDASGVSDGCGYNNSDGKRLYSDFGGGESFPSNFTIMAFIKPTGNHYTSDHPMGISLANVSNYTSFGIGFTQDNSTVQFSFLRELEEWRTQTSTPASIVNTWHHYALTFDGTTMKGYIDGTEVISQGVSGSGRNDGTLHGGLTVFGRNSDNYTNTIQGYVDEAIVENKVWTASDIQTYLSNFTY